MLLGGIVGGYYGQQQQSGGGGAGGAVPQYGGTLPSNPTEGQLFELLKQTQLTEAFTEKIDRTGENTAADFGNRSIGILTLESSTGLHIPFDSVLDAIHFRGLQPNDKIIAKADGHTDTIITLSQPMTWESDSGTLFSPSAGGYSHTGSIVDDVRYTLYAIRVNRYFEARTLLNPLTDAGTWNTSPSTAGSLMNPPTQSVSTGILTRHSPILMYPQGHSHGQAKKPPRM